MKRVLMFCLLSMIITHETPLLAQTRDRIRVIAVFAHPDDADGKMGGTAALLARMGVAVKFVSITNGDAGHYAQGGGALARRRREEARKAAIQYGIDEYAVLNNHDGELLPTLDVRLQVIREIRKWNADVVIGLRPNDYHPDHRNAGKLVEDASYMVAVPNVASDVPALKKNPVFLYMQDNFSKPNKFSHDIVIAIDEAIDKKMDGLNEHVSQVYEWLPWIANKGDTSMVPKQNNPEARKKWLRETDLYDRYHNKVMNPDQRQGLEKWYGKEKAAKVKYAESFEITEYGSQPTAEEIRNLFPMLKNNQ
ncbi:MAG TPA: PIG-L family deacetylase [Flavitalea sp.]|nr:PIG-L family deacetylase [Flavitalea sp.]